MNRKVISLFCVMALVILSALSLTGYGSAQTQKTIKIGVVGPESGGCGPVGPRPTQGDPDGC